MTPDELIDAANVGYRAATNNELDLDDHWSPGRLTPVNVEGDSLAYFITDTLLGVHATESGVAAYTQSIELLKVAQAQLQACIQSLEAAYLNDTLFNPAAPKEDAREKDSADGEPR